MTYLLDTNIVSETSKPAPDEKCVDLATRLMSGLSYSYSSGPGAQRAESLMSSR
jgi:hypothetical protein